MFKQEVMRTLNYIMVIEMEVSQWIRDILDGAILGLGSCYKDQLGREESRSLSFANDKKLTQVSLNK